MMQNPETMLVYYIGPPKWGPVVINKDSFDSALHEDAEKPAETKAEAPKRGRPKRAKE